MRGGDSSGLRAYNERLIVSALLSDGPMSKAAIARETGLSGQAATVIVNALLESGLLMKLDKVRGQVGQPSTPIAPNPAGAYSVGVKIGRRSVETILVNLLGEIIDSHDEQYAPPLADRAMSIAVTSVKERLRALDAVALSRVVGLGVAMPTDLHLWSSELDMPESALSAWRDTDVEGVLQDASGLTASVYNDATAACAAELIAGGAITTQSAFYVYIGTFIGGGVVIDGKLYRGKQFNAGAIGSMPVEPCQDSKPPEQLLHRASLLSLESALRAAGMDPLIAIRKGGVEAAEPIFDDWVARAAPELARALVSVTSVIDFEAVVIDGLLHADWRRRFTDAVQAHLSRFNSPGLSPITVVTGSIGSKARVLGAAMMPLRMRFSPDLELIASASPPAASKR